MKPLHDCSCADPGALPLPPVHQAAGAAQPQPWHAPRTPPSRRAPAPRPQAPLPRELTPAPLLAPAAPRCRRWQKTFGWGFPFAWGEGILFRWGLLPHRVPLTCVVGAPLGLPRWEGPCSGEAFEAAVEAAHAR
jgi:hypothetical protein